MPAIGSCALLSIQLVTVDADSGGSILRGNQQTQHHHAAGGGGSRPNHISDWQWYCLQHAYADKLHCSLINSMSYPLHMSFLDSSQGLNRSITDRPCKKGGGGVEADRHQCTSAVAQGLKIFAFELLTTLVHGRSERT